MGRNSSKGRGWFLQHRCIWSGQCVLETVLGEEKTRKDKELNKSWFLTSRSSRFSGHGGIKANHCNSEWTVSIGHSKIFWWRRGGSACLSLKLRRWDKTSSSWDISSALTQYRLLPVSDFRAVQLEAEVPPLALFNSVSSWGPYMFPWF